MYIFQEFVQKPRIASLSKNPARVVATNPVDEIGSQKYTRVRRDERDQVVYLPIAQTSSFLLCSLFFCLFSWCLTKKRRNKLWLMACWRLTINAYCCLFMHRAGRQNISLKDSMYFIASFVSDWIFLIEVKINSEPSYVWCISLWCYKRNLSQTDEAAGLY